MNEHLENEACSRPASGTHALKDKFLAGLDC